MVTSLPRLDFGGFSSSSSFPNCDVGILYFDIEAEGAFNQGKRAILEV
jgi:hypothetical protein